MIRAVSHVAIRVTELESAETFYRQLFDTEVLFREARLSDGWVTFPPAATWADIKRAGVLPDLCFLERDAFGLALERAQEQVEMANGVLSHVCIVVDDHLLAMLRERAEPLGCRILLDRPKTQVFADPFGVKWEVTTGTKSRSTGEQTGRWISL